MCDSDICCACSSSFRILFQWKCNAVINFILHNLHVKFWGWIWIYPTDSLFGIFFSCSVFKWWKFNSRYPTAVWCTLQQLFDVPCTLIFQNSYILKNIYFNASYKINWNFKSDNNKKNIRKWTIEYRNNAYLINDV